MEISGASPISSPEEPVQGCIRGSVCRNHPGCLAGAGNTFLIAFVCRIEQTCRPFELLLIWDGAGAGIPKVVSLFSIDSVIWVRVILVFIGQLGRREVACDVSTIGAIAMFASSQLKCLAC